MGTTNILDLNNRLSKVEKENVTQNSYTSLKNKPKINNVTLTGNKSSSDLGLAAASDITSLQSGKANSSDLLFGEFSTDGFDPLTQCSGFFCFSVFPNKGILQGVPTDCSPYGTVFGCSGTRYKLLIYIDVLGKFAVLTGDNTWVTY